MQNKFVTGTRWFLVLPISLCMVILIAWLSAYFFNTSLEQNLETAVVRAVRMLISTVGSIWLAYMIAPSSKFKAALWISVTWLIILFIVIIIALTGTGLGGQQQKILDGGISIISAVSGIFLGIILCKKLNQGTTISEERLIKRIAKLDGLSGMTVNERLYVSKLDQVFCKALKTDPVKAKTILTLLKVDQASIELILKNSSEPD